MEKIWSFDLGASNGRLMLTEFDGERINIEEMHRFSNQPISLTGHYYWDILRVFQEMKVGMMKSVKKGHKNVASMAVDTWGVDFGLLSRTGELIGNPYSYRDNQTSEGMKILSSKISEKDLFRRTGIEPSPINTIYQLQAIQNHCPEMLDKADALLLTPSLLSYFFSGVKANEYTISTTTALYNFSQKNWDPDLIKLLNLSRSVLSPIVQPGTILGNTMDTINRELNINSVKVIAGAGHDTACALAALPKKHDDSIFMSCGTWILVGVEVNEPVVSDEAYHWGFTNEGTVEGKHRLQKNNMGLWLIQKSKEVWERQGVYTSYKEEEELVRQTHPFQSFVDPDHTDFLNPENIVKQIQAFCRLTNQPIPETRGEILRCILESLAMKFKWVIDRLESLTGKQLNVINMGGGGIQNRWLCQFTANATQKTVIAGPVEVSSIGNAIGQLLALGEINSLSEGRELVEQSFSTKIYHPENNEDWIENYDKFTRLIDTSNR